MYMLRLIRAATRALCQVPRPSLSVTMSSWGICPVLDYDISSMIDFVTQNIPTLLAQPQLTPDYHAFISAILRPARLPKATVLLALQYMTDQESKQSLQFDMKPLLCIPFMVASKFLDDQTFRNQSWAKVSGIGLLELDTMERIWLSHRSFNLYVDLDTNPDYATWQTRWLVHDSIRKQSEQSRHDDLARIACRRTLAPSQRTGCVSRHTGTEGKKTKVALQWDGRIWKYGALHVRSTLQGKRVLPPGLCFHLPSSTFTWNGKLWRRHDKASGDGQWVRHEDMASHMPQCPVYFN